MKRIWITAIMATALLAPAAMAQSCPGMTINKSDSQSSRCDWQSIKGSYTVTRSYDVTCKSGSLHYIDSLTGTGQCMIATSIGLMNCEPEFILASEVPKLEIRGQYWSFIPEVRNQDPVNVFDVPVVCVKGAISRGGENTCPNPCACGTMSKTFPVRDALPAPPALLPGRKRMS